MIVIWQQWKNKNLCRRYLYTNIFEIKLILGEDTRFLPLKLRKMAGPLHRVGINRIPSSRQINLIRGWMWDTLTINWSDIEMFSGDETIQLPNTIIVPLRAKFKVRQIINDQCFTVSMALTQDNNWYDLNQTSHRTRAGPNPPLRATPRSPDSRPLLQLVNARINPDSEERTETLSNMTHQTEGAQPPFPFSSPEPDAPNQI